MTDKWEITSSMFIGMANKLSKSGIIWAWVVFVMLCHISPLQSIFYPKRRRSGIGAVFLQTNGLIVCLCPFFSALWNKHSQVYKEPDLLIVIDLKSQHDSFMLHAPPHWTHTFIIIIKYIVIIKKKNNSVLAEFHYLVCFLESKSPEGKEPERIFARANVCLWSYREEATGVMYYFGRASSAAGSSAAWF